MEPTRILVADPRAAYRALRAEIDAAMGAVLESPAYILGEVVERFEAAFAAYIGVSHGIGVNNGTDAIHLALRALDIGVGDEVITVSHTAVATVVAVRMSGATPVLCDVDPRTRTIDPLVVARSITERTKAILAVHLYGHPVPLDELKALCEHHGLKLIEDCAQAHGAMYRGRMVGSIGDVSAFSFYPTKNLGAIGDGGMVLTGLPQVASRLRALRQYGWDTPQYSLVEGWNSRLDPLQAAVLHVKLGHLDRHVERRRELAAGYTAALAGLPLVLPGQEPGCRHAYHLYVVELNDRGTRDALLGHLAGQGIGAGVHYPFPVHLQPAYKGWVRTTAMPVTEALAGTVLSLPVHPDLSGADHNRVCTVVRGFFDQRS